MMWFWNSGQERFKTLDCPNRLDQILVRTGLSPSVAEATRLIKQGSVRLRPGDCGICVLSQEATSAEAKFEKFFAWRAISAPRWALPMGRLWQVRVGKSPLRLLPREGQAGWDCFQTTAELMFPLPYQGLRCWTDLMRLERIRWHSPWLDRLERFYAHALGMAQRTRSDTT
jgi:hypothetical protein